jgi:RNA polymerase sigma-70 factor (ECF subfamily)
MGLGKSISEQVAELYRTESRRALASPSPVVELKPAIAVAMRDGPAAGLALIDAPFARPRTTTERDHLR